MSPPEEFFQHLLQAFEHSTLVKLTLSQPVGQLSDDLKNVYIRPVSLKKGPHLAFTYRYKTRDEVKNYSAPDSVAELKKLLGTAFRQSDLLTTGADFSLSYNKNGEIQLKSKKPSQISAPGHNHDRSKQRLLDSTAPWLHALGITSARGEVLAAAQDKWRQINKYLEVIDALLREHPLPTDARIADMGSGKGYLTFALYNFLTTQRGMQPQITGIELRPKLVEQTNRIARENNFNGLIFTATDINDYHPDRIDMLIALHACDIATDLALAKGIWEKAAVIVAAPCCHKQVRRDMEAQNEMAPLLRFGILEERQAEIVTDGIRALLLEAEGYKTKVFEFISTEHTPKNVMITAVKSLQTNKKALEQILALKKGFGISEHYLETLLEKNKTQP